MWETPFHYFTDAVLRGPTIGCMLMCLSAALVGVLVFLRKQSLLGESLSHASYPGVVIGIVIAAALGVEEDQSFLLSFLIMLSACLSALLGLWTIHWLEKNIRVKSDSALCFVLSAFFGIGLTLASRVQFSYPIFYRQIQAYLYGQAATMTDAHILIYFILAVLVIALILFFYKELLVMTFDREYGKSMGIPVAYIDFFVFVLIVLAVIIGIRSVGVILMSAMLIAPAAAARQYTNKLSTLFILAGMVGLLSGFLGNYFSVEISRYLVQKYPTDRLSLPTGPMIVITASLICLFSLLFAPERGVVLRVWRMRHFRYRCICENLLKSICRENPNQIFNFTYISKFQSLSPFYLRFIMWRLVKSGWINKISRDHYQLSPSGQIWGAKIVRLHRLWEVYLVDYLGVGAEKVHKNAEEMEHILTPSLEKELMELLKDPKKDPHHQPIPPYTEGFFHV